MSTRTIGLLKHMKVLGFSSMNVNSILMVYKNKLTLNDRINLRGYYKGL